MNALDPRASWRWSRREDRILAVRRYRGDRAKDIARDLGRSPSSVHERFQLLQRKLEDAHGDILAKHRAEELELLDKLLAEAGQPEMLGSERR
jgi:DNA-binding NarL/FixJ family response regulator